MQSKLFHGLIATCVLIIVSIPDITLANNQQKTLTPRERSCIDRELKKLTEHHQREIRSDEYSTLTKLIAANSGKPNPDKQLAILQKLAQLNGSYERDIIDKCLSKKRPAAIRGDREKIYSAEDVSVSELREPSRRTDSHIFFSKLNSIKNEALGGIRNLSTNTLKLRKEFVEASKLISKNFHIDGKWVAATLVSSCLTICKKSKAENKERE